MDRLCTVSSWDNLNTKKKIICSWGKGYSFVRSTYVGITERVCLVLDGSVSICRRVLSCEQRIVEVLRTSAVYPIFPQLGLSLPVLDRERDERHRDCHQQNYQNDLRGASALALAGERAGVGAVAAAFGSWRVWRRSKSRISCLNRNRVYLLPSFLLNMSRKCFIILSFENMGEFK